ncbi:MAG: hypothetical protein ABWZ98_18190 [Nakamurella sp.]
MTAPKVRNFLLGLGLLVAAFGVIYAFTPGGFSWPLVVVGLLMVLPWFAAECRRRRMVQHAPRSGVPRWHPESEEYDR